ncbi:MAG: DNA polymerase III subunit delta [Puniceicoccales bacterium]|jgi:DNA polymerase-3 subunit delta|nr:DNA polymerase III subunit delta [Puniceicoccales bacterium]
MSSARFYFFLGDDEFLVERAARACFEKLSEDATDEFLRETIDATSQKAEDVKKALDAFLAAVRTMPMFGGKKYIWLRGVNWFAKDTVLAGTKVVAECEGVLTDALEKIDTEAVCVVISAYPAYRARTGIKWLESHGETTCIQTASKSSFFKSAEKVPAATVELMDAECRELGIKLSAATRQELFDKVDGNTRLLIEELRKLACFLGSGGGAVTSEMILQLVPNFGEGDFFEPVEAFFSGNLGNALDALRRFFFHNPDAGRAILTSLQNRNRLLIQLRVLLDSGELRLGPRGIDDSDWSRAVATYGVHFGDSSEKTALNVFSQTSTWYVGNLARSAKLFSLRNLTELQLDLVQSFGELLSRPNEQEAVLRELFVRNLSTRS